VKLLEQEQEESQTLGNGQNDLPMRNRKTDLFGNVNRGQQGPFLVTRWARTPLLAGEGDKHLVLAVGATNPSKSCLQIATLEKGGYRTLDDGPPVAVLGSKAIVVDLLKGVKVLIQQGVKVLIQQGVKVLIQQPPQIRARESDASPSPECAA
jgi:hypothetical protein